MCSSNARLPRPRFIAVERFPPRLAVADWVARIAERVIVENAPDIRPRAVLTGGAEHAGGQSMRTTRSAAYRHGAAPACWRQRRRPNEAHLAHGGVRRAASTVRLASAFRLASAVRLASAARPLLGG